jgi:thiosulfate dehydrogenase (quinone) large subunit
MKVKSTKLTDMQLVALIALRVAIGWHFFYEGLIKLLSPNWSSMGFLLESEGFLSPVFQRIASSPKLLPWVDGLNEWGLAIIGAGLILGCFTRFSAYSAMVLLALYYLSHPPFLGFNFAQITEGSYFIVDNVLIEFFAAWVLAIIPTGRYLGIDVLWRNRAFKRKRIRTQN